jgi:hypothetical protein
MEIKTNEILSHTTGWIRTHRGVLFVLAIALLFVTIVLSPENPTEGTIEKPVQNQKVPRLISVEGTIHNLPKKHGLWLAVQVGDLIWPKLPKIKPAKTKWLTSFTEGGNPNGTLTIVLLSATPKADAALQKWLDDGDYKGIPVHTITGISLLDDVTVQPMWTR